MVRTAAQKVSEAEYLEKERNSEEKFEYDNGILTPMSGASLNHNGIVVNLIGILWLHLRENPVIKVRSNDMRVYCPYGQKYYYPDVVINFEEDQTLDKHFDTLLNPNIIIEVLSSSTEQRDRTTKFEAYRSIPSFKEYILVSQEEAKIERFYQNKNGDWIIVEPLMGLDKSYNFQHIDFNIKLKEIYRGIKF